MVRAAEHGISAARCVREQRTAVTADVVEGAELKVGAPDDEDPFRHEPCAQPLTGETHVVLATDADPGSIEDRRLLVSEDRVIDVGDARQGDSLFEPGEHGIELGPGNR
jgi:hypothetical protein